jgi:putative peptidoglycan lipid II flippase
MTTDNHTADRARLKKSLTAATIIMMASVMLSRVIGLVREQVLAGYGGTSSDIDAYVTAFIIPEILNHLLAGGFLSITFIPIFQRYLAKNDTAGGWRSFSNLLTIGTAVFLVIVPLAVVFTPALYRFFPHALSANSAQFDLTVRLTRIIIPAQLLFYWGAFFSAVQMANHKFFLPALSPLLYNLGIIAGGLLLGPRLGVEGFAWGVLAGAFAANILVLLPGALRAGMRFRPVADFSHADVKEFVLLSLPLMLGLGMTFSNEVLFRFFGVSLGEGGTSSINYALRTMGMIVAVFGQASGVAFYPYLSKLALEKKFGEITAILNRALVKIGLMCVPVSLMLVVLAQEVISVLYERGNFSAASTAATASVFVLYMAGAFSFAAAIFAVRPFYAVQRPWIPMVISTAVSLLTLPLYAFASRHWGAPGIAGSAVAGMTVQFITLYLVWAKLYGSKKQLREVLRPFFIVGLTGCAAALCGMAAKQWVLSLDLFLGKTALNLAVCAITVVPMGAIVVLIYHLTGLQKIGDLVKRVPGLR